MNKQNNNWSVYEHWTPDNEVYVGISSDIERRWEYGGCNYHKETLFGKCIQKYGWENITHTVVSEFDTMEEALQLEDDLIQLYREQDCSLNSHRSGFVWKKDPKEYDRLKHKKARKTNGDAINARRREKRKENPEKFRETERKRLAKPWGKIYNRVNNFNHHHPDKITITPLEAKNNYINYGIIPSFIKHSDLEGVLYDPYDGNNQLCLF